MREIQPRDLIIDNHDRIGIVTHEAETPDASWIADQRDTSVRALVGTCRWWHVLPLSGGSVIVAEPHASYVRTATLQDALSAVAGGNDSAAQLLLALFPELRDWASRRPN